MLIRKLILISIFLTYPLILYCADISMKCGNNICWLTLHGEILPGDSDKIISKINEAKEDGLFVANINLRSAGGNVKEAIDIGKSIRKNFITTRVPSWWTPVLSDKKSTICKGQGLSYEECEENFGLDYEYVGYIRTSDNTIMTSSMRAFNDLYRGVAQGLKHEYDPHAMCASACTLIHLAGLKRENHKVGVHFLSLSDKSLDFEDLEKQLLEGSNTVENYLKDIRAPYKFMDGILSASSTEMIWLKEKEDPPYEYKRTHHYNRVFNEYLLSKCQPLSRISDEDYNIMMAMWFSIEFGRGNFILNGKRLELKYTDRKLYERLKAQEEAFKRCENDTLYGLAKKAQQN